ncbi:hypothetical protein BDV93DRAFT_521582 [Ceratobasidium sp. AG-I]|nr:hypothetical protein BDV93DRAFT_521582 [Ceratobasidium sp. AG-I]
MPKPSTRKKYVDDKASQLLLASQVIESKEETKTKTQHQTRAPKQQVSRRQKSHKLDAIKVSIAQRERNRRSARKKARQDQVELETSNHPGQGDPRAAGNGTESSDEPMPGQRRKQVTFA